jgi:DNA (cytosine-5)-methyltransferase 1
MVTLKDAPADLRRQLIVTLLEVRRQRALRPDAPFVIDFFCCEGGGSQGLHEAGFIVVGVDADPRLIAGKRPLYPFPLIMADAIEWFELIVSFLRPDAVVGSPPCQADTDAQVIQNREHPRLIAPFRELVLATGLPYWIENVGGAVRKGNLRADVRLCGLMFGLKTDRHRYFELNFPVELPEHPVGPRGREDHEDLPKTKMGRPFVEGELRQYVGNFHGPELARADLGTPWMTRRGMAECIPPAYGRFLGEQLLRHLQRLAVPAVLAPAPVVATPRPQWHQIERRFPDRPLMFDGCSGAGGAAMGYWQAGFEVVCLDIEEQPSNPFQFIRGSILDLDPEWLAAHFDASHWSPPCQGYGRTRHRNPESAAKYPRLIPDCRQLSNAAGLPYVIENVEDARPHMEEPIMLCGSSFGLRVRRHRLFETNAALEAPDCEHAWQDDLPCYRVYVGKSRTNGLGYKHTGVMPVFGGNQLVGGGSFRNGSIAMGIHWMKQPELNESIPPAYTLHLGRQLIKLLP